MNKWMTNHIENKQSSQCMYTMYLAMLHALTL